MRTHLQRPDTDFPTSACNNGLDPAWITTTHRDVTCGHCLRHIPRPTVRTFQGETGEDESCNPHDAGSWEMGRRAAGAPEGANAWVLRPHCCSAPTPTEPQ